MYVFTSTPQNKSCVFLSITIGKKWLITLEGGDQPCLFSIFHFFLCLHHPNNHLENIPLPLFNSVSKNKHIEILEGHSSPLHYPPPQLNLCLYISIDKVGKSKHNKTLLRYKELKERQHVSALYYKAIIRSDMEN
jgi:hypothetical protein